MATDWLKKILTWRNYPPMPLLNFCRTSLPSCPGNELIFSRRKEKKARSSAGRPPPPLYSSCCPWPTDVLRLQVHVYDGFRFQFVSSCEYKICDADEPSRSIEYLAYEVSTYCYGSRSIYGGPHLPISARVQHIGCVYWPRQRQGLLVCPANFSAWWLQWRRRGIERDDSAWIASETM